MEEAVIYIHGNGGTAEEAEHYKKIFPDRNVIGFDYKAQTPWEAVDEFQQFYDDINALYKNVSVVANSIGAYFCMNSLSGKSIDMAYFISPIVNMEKLISDMMLRANVTKKELQEKKTIKTDFGETLSWEYLCYVKNHPVKWQIPTRILYGEKDTLTSYETILEFAKQTGASLMVMKEGEHWFHTKEQMQFLDDCIIQTNR